MKLKSDSRQVSKEIVAKGQTVGSFKKELLLNF